MLGDETPSDPPGRFDKFQTFSKGSLSIEIIHHFIIAEAEYRRQYRQLKIDLLASGG